MHLPTLVGLLTLAGVVLVGAAAVPAAEGRAAADKAADQAIRRHRMGTIVVRAAAGARVKVTQTRHEFWFGTAVSRRMWRPDAPQADRAKYLEVLAANFNSAVHENALKWYGTEREKDQVSYADADRMLQWCREHGLAVRGHCLFWGVERFVQPWIKELGDDELRRRIQRRAREVTSRYRGRIVEYDVNNEMIHGDYYARRLGDDIRAQMFKWAKAGDGDALLYVNDYNILTGRDVARYEKHIEGLLAAGAPVGGIGVQGHFGKPVDMKRVKAALDRLARFKLPIRVTEYDLNTGDEEVKARHLADFYTTCFAHPAVEGILMWGFWEGSHWRPKAALWKKDWTPTRAAEAYRGLVFGRWWTRRQGVADDKGACEVPAFFGRHRVKVGEAEKEVELRKADAAVEIDARAAEPEQWTVRPVTRPGEAPERSGE
jgi:GH35 family endo-1,4-beta-xylanase